MLSYEEMMLLQTAQRGYLEQLEDMLCKKENIDYNYYMKIGIYNALERKHYINIYDDPFYINFCECVINDLVSLAKNEKIDSNIHYLSSGKFTDSFKIGNKVITFGNAKDDKNIINYSMPLVPNFIKNFKDINFRVSVANLVDTKNITANDTYQVWKQLYEEGYYWADPRNNNIGRLVLENTHGYQNISDLGKEFLGIPNTPNLKNTKINDLVIFDHDYIYNKNNIPTYIKEQFKEANNFEKRYMEEKNEEVSSIIR